MSHAAHVCADHADRRDRPAITAAFFAALAAHDVDVRDIEQVVIRDRLILTVLFDFRGDPAALRNSVTTTAGALGMECDVAVATRASGCAAARSARAVTSSCSATRARWTRCAASRTSSACR
ncbi:MAG: hypothetical protein M3070_03930 [Actinomycetota bacterium]|nr:hypothetical protein [Actinomycetota bacterium]